MLLRYMVETLNKVKENNTAKDSLIKQITSV